MKDDIYATIWSFSYTKTASHIRNSHRFWRHGLTARTCFDPFRALSRTGLHISEPGCRRLHWRDCRNRRGRVEDQDSTELWGDRAGHDGHRHWHQLSYWSLWHSP